MKKKLYSFLAYLAPASFLMFWAWMIICTLPPNYVTHFVNSKAPQFKMVFGYTWRLFTPPYTSNHRLYFIVKNIERSQKTDTIEVLENLSRRKQQKVPFNQKERDMDFLVQKTVTNTLRTVWQYKQMPNNDIPGTTDSLYIANAMSANANSNVYQDQLRSFDNYCKIVLGERGITSQGKEVKILITEKLIRPYKERNNSQFVQKENIVFETIYRPLRNDTN